MKVLPLKFANGSHLKYNENYIQSTVLELEEFLEKHDNLAHRSFAKSVMVSHELRANNQIEGYGDDVILISEIIKKRYPDLNSNMAKRILNLYHGYEYILKGYPINKETLRELYTILSRDILEKTDQDRMGTYYRTAPVYILKNGYLDIYNEGLEASKIDEFMNAYLEFLQNFDNGSSMTDEYIKSQILHFYFVYIHPYFDVNGRTSRTVAMWYLLNKKAYPYIIFNRGIPFKGSDYDHSIQKGIESYDISYFINYMLKTVEEELEKEYIIECMEKNSNYKFNAEEFQTILYLLTSNDLLSVTSFTAFYNRLHSKKKNKEIYETMILPLIEKGILQVVRTSNKNMFDNVPNQILSFNPSIFQYDHSEIKKLTRYK